MLIYSFASSKPETGPGTGLRLNNRFTLTKSGRSLSFASAASASLFTFLFLIFLGGALALSVTVNNVECVYEYVYYEGDSVSGNLIAVDHDVFWSSDHPGIDFTVTSSDGNTVHNLKGTTGDKFDLPMEILVS